MLKGRNDRRSSILLQEALTLAHVPEQSIEIAFEKINNDPEFTYDFLQKLQLSDLEKLELSLKALNEMDKNYVTRSKIASLAIDLIQKTGEKQGLLDYCLQERFRSNTTSGNLLSMLVNSLGPTEEVIKKAKEITEEVKNEIETRSSQANYDSLKSHGILNSLYDKDRRLFEFLYGDFIPVLEKKVLNGPDLGWSHSFLKSAIPLYTFLILDNENLPDSFLCRLNSIIELLGPHYDSMKNEEREAYYLDQLKKWKALFPLTVKQKEMIIDVLDKVMEKRVDAVMSKNRRNYYYECATFIDEIASAKQVLDPNYDPIVYLNKFIDFYPRRYNFVADLKSFFKNH